MTKKWEKPIIEDSKLTKFNYIVQYPENLKMGINFDIGSFTYINSKFGVEIQDDVQIGSHCSIYSHSTIDQKKGTVLLKKNCKIGTHSTIMPNVTIGENSVIAAYSFVNKDVPDNEIWTIISLVSNLKFTNNTFCLILISTFHHYSIFSIKISIFDFLYSPIHFVSWFKFFTSSGSSLSKNACSSSG